VTTRLARLISNVFDPIPTTVLLGLIGILSTPMGPRQRLFWFTLVAVMAILVAFIVLWFVRAGFVIDARLKEGQDHHRDRLGVLWITNSLLVIAVIVASMIGRAEPLWSILVGMTTVLVLATLVTGVYKVSIHMIGIASLVTVLLMQYRSAALPALLLVPIVAWSRRVLHRHTPSQLIVGTVVAGATLVAVFALTGQL
jgi:membrane-associated phospholipid phosphatase